MVQAMRNEGICVYLCSDSSTNVSKQWNSIYSFGKWVNFLINGLMVLNFLFKSLDRVFKQSRKPVILMNMMW